jgi:predicted 3-demethylubiquinone-9 3-methyltransferase (glyoxalase superfamily)
MPGITPCLWFATEGHDEAEFYVSIFENSHITDVTPTTARAGPGQPGPS